MTKWLLLVLALTLTMTAQAEIKVEKINFGGWPNSYRMTNGDVEVVVTTDIGPRVMRYAFPGGQNLLWEDKAGLGKSGEKDWQLRGGHRVWIGPEDIKYTYGPDNGGPIDLKHEGRLLTATGPSEPMTGVQKQLIVEMADKGSFVKVTNRLINRSNLPLEFSVWALSMMAPGGMGISGFPPRGTHPADLPPTNPLIMWAFTNLSDPRWKFTRKYMMLRQDPSNSDPQKLGHFNPKTWGAYLLGSDLFVKRYNPDPAKAHPDFHCSYETFTNEKFLEIETLGPLTKVPSGGHLDLIERWTLHKNVAVPSWTDAEIDKNILPHVLSID